MIITRFDPLNPGDLPPSIPTPRPKAKGKKAKGAGKTTSTPSADRNPLDKVIAGFKRKGIPEDNIIPRTNILTFKGWMEQGRVVKKGEHGVPYGGTRLFHLSQTKPLNEASPAPAAPAQATPPPSNVVSLPMAPTPPAPKPAAPVPVPTALPPATPANIIPVKFQPTVSWRDHLLHRRT